MVTPDALRLGGTGRTTPALAAELLASLPRALAGPGVLVTTSGSTGAPRTVALSAAALRASAEATHARLHGPGHWLLALPVDHVAGLQVLVRSALAGTEPVVMDLRHGFLAADLAEAAAAVPAGDGPRYVSLVPTQLHRVMDDAAAVAALADFDAVLLGGAAVDRGLLDAARLAGVPAVTTYGMTETCGGCVYDGVPLDGVHIRLDADARIRVAGPVLADGYLDRPADPAFAELDGRRWFVTSDLGRLDDDGKLTVLGRADDVVITGGEKVHPAAVEAVLAAMPGVRQAAVLGVDHPLWGQQVVAALRLHPGCRPPTLEAIRAEVGRALGPAAAPRRIAVVEELPLLGPGKVDRAGLSWLFRD